MTGITGPAAGGPESREHELAAAVISALLREDYGGLSGWVRYAPGVPVLRLPGSGLAVPLEPDGFLADLRVSLAGPPLKLGDVEAVVAAIADPADSAGVAAFGEECREALAALRLRDAHSVPGNGVPGGGSAPVSWLSARRSGPGFDGAVEYDALAAVMPHPAYPTSACKLGFTDEDHLRYAPEYRPEFELNWVAVPKTGLTRGGDARPRWWPRPRDVGLPESCEATHELLPAHPLTASRVIPDVYDAVIAPETAVRVRPTLSVRTVALISRPGTHLKLPLPVSTLGLRNHRSIAPATLADGALVHRVLAGLVSEDPALGGLLLADDSTYLHSGHRFLGCLLRRFPSGLSGCHVVPAAGLLAPAGDGGSLVIDRLAGEAGVSVSALAAAWFDLVFRIAVRLFVRYGIALESHQQNAALVLDPAAAVFSARGDAASAPPGGMRLLVKDFDGALINHPRLMAALGRRAPAAAAFADERMLTGSDHELADVFTTVTVHLCAGAIAFGLADRGRAPLGNLLALARQSLAAALDDCQGDPVAEFLRSRVLGAPRLPGKAMLTACTLAGKSRTGARDVNKHIGVSGPNYLRLPGGGW